jgi:hypothetical protein
MWRLDSAAGDAFTNIGAYDSGAANSIVSLLARYTDGKAYAQMDSSASGLVSAAVADTHGLTSPLISHRIRARGR